MINPDTFWEEWMKADDLGRFKIMEKLTVFNMIKDDVTRRSFIGMLNFYLADFHGYIKNSTMYETSEKRAVVNDAVEIEQMNP